MAKDPLAPRKTVVARRALDKATICRMFQDYGLAADTIAYQEAKAAIQQLLRTSLTPCVITIALMADIAPEKLYRAAIEKVFLNYIDKIAANAFAPPLSRNAIYERVILDWLFQTVAIDGY